MKYLNASFLFSKSQEAVHCCQRRRRLPLHGGGSIYGGVLRGSQISATAPLRQIRSLLFESDVYENPRVIGVIRWARWILGRGDDVTGDDDSYQPRTSFQQITVAFMKMRGTESKEHNSISFKIHEFLVQKSLVGLVFSHNLVTLSNKIWKNWDLLSSCEGMNLCHWWWLYQAAK